MRNMEKNIEELGQAFKPLGADFFDLLWNESWAYIKTVVDIAHEPILILDKNFRIMAANDSFYKAFQVESKNTEGKVIYELGNGQWDIPALRKLIEDILPNNTFFKGFEVTHDFPIIGRKTMILNARQIHFPDSDVLRKFPSIMLLAIEDITEMMVVAETLADHAKQLESRLTERTEKLEIYIGKLEKEINELKNKL